MVTRTALTADLATLSAHLGHNAGEDGSIVRFFYFCLC